MQSRRDLLQKLGLAAAVGVVSTASSAAAAAPAVSATLQRDTLRALAEGGSASGSAAWLLAPLQAGQSVGLGWRLHSLSPVERGAVVITLRHARHTEAAPVEGRVHLCAHHGAPRGLAHTALFDLVLMDGGQGARPTDEALGRVVLTLAAKVRTNELSGDLGSVARLLTHAERVALYGPESLT